MYFKKLEALSGFLDFIREKFNLHVVINDFNTFLDSEKSAVLFLSGHMVHHNPYCMYIKSNKELWNKCYADKKTAMERCACANEVFCTTCHAGVTEYIIPVSHHGRVIAFMSVGAFMNNARFTDELTGMLSRDFNLCEDKLREYYNGSLTDGIAEIELIRSIFNLLAEYISCVYEEYLLLPHKDATIIKTDEAYALNHIIAYIRINHKDKITLKDIALFCHYSPSSVSHFFKKNTGMTIRAYLNMVRIEHAKRLLAEKRITVNDIAYETGFNDADYFSKVFGELCGMSPTKYRESIL